MYEPTSGYHPSPGINGQGLPYHVSMTAGSPAAVSADKNSLLLSAATGVRQPVSHHGSVVHHQGNLQPGYPPRPVEISSRSSDKLSTIPAVTSSCSTGYPGLVVTGQAAPAAPVTQDERVTSSCRSAQNTKDSVQPPLLPPPPDYGSSRLPPGAVVVNPAPLITPGLYSSTAEFSSLLQTQVPAAMTALHSPNTQPTFLACSAAVELVKVRSLINHR